VTDHRNVRLEAITSASFPDVNSKQLIFRVIDGFRRFHIVSRRLLFLFVSLTESSDDFGNGTGRIDS
jgi:hypothetical protein